MEEGNGRLKPSTISMTISNPIYPEDYQGKKHSKLAEEIQAIIEGNLHSHVSDSLLEVHAVSK
ncbi:hypothetical protein [Virgibacillus doumboii]|uniref:hypothetical protein n=1 Tax=Virgibacillus doumboii TaxID=2697503 RepID=UPI001FE54735|nr:hypothetical protein [Virgibacillus doumboii]